MSTNQIVSKVWSFCNTLRDDGVGYGDYLEQLTYLLFLKMADEYTRAPYNRTMPIQAAYNWQSLTPHYAAQSWRFITLQRFVSWVRRKAYSGRYLPRAKIRYRTLPSCTNWLT